eukprot:scaffold7600_cov76-Isochrysis_galbana.AAC.2
MSAFETRFEPAVGQTEQVGIHECGAISAPPDVAAHARPGAAGHPGCILANRPPGCISADGPPARRWRSGGVRGVIAARPTSTRGGFPPGVFTAAGAFVVGPVYRVLTAAIACTAHGVSKEAGEGTACPKWSSGCDPQHVFPARPGLPPRSTFPLDFPPWPVLPPNGAPPPKPALLAVGPISTGIDEIAISIGRGELTTSPALHGIAISGGRREVSISPLSTGEKAIAFSPISCISISPISAGKLAISFISAHAGDSANGECSSDLPLTPSVHSDEASRAAVPPGPPGSCASVLAPPAIVSLTRTSLSPSHPHPPARLPRGA